MYYTKSGKLIEFKRIENYIDDPKSGWIVNILLAYVDNEPVGYLKNSYIPKEKEKLLYPDLLHYLINRRGFASLKEAVYSKDPGLILTSLKPYSYFTNTYIGDIPEEFEAQAKLLTKTLKVMDKNMKFDYKTFLDFHVDKPMVDFIAVYTENDSMAYTEKDRDSVERVNLVNWQRQNIGMALYLETADWLKTKGLNLYASGIQQPNAKLAWDKLATLYELGCDIKNASRRILDINKPKLNIDFLGL